MKVGFDLSPEVKHYSKKRLNYNKGNYAQLRSLLDIDWDSALGDSVDIDHYWHTICNKIKSAEQDSIPAMRLRRGGGACSVLLDRKIRSKIKRKQRLWNQYTRNRDPRVYNEYCCTRNQVRRLTRKRQREYEKNIASQVRQYPKKFWSYANQKTKAKETIPNLSVSGNPDDNIFTTDDDGKVGVLASFFSSVFTREPPGHWDLPMDAHPEMSEDLNITEDIVYKRLENLNTCKSPGPDAIHPRILYEARQQLAKPLSLLFRLSLASGDIPKDWKLANITAIHKKGDKRVAGNYRPVSLTSIVCKLLEGIIRDRIVNHMQRYNLFSDKQFGFISGRSTLLQLLTVLDRWTEALDNGEEVDVIFMDFRKAFDKVPHRRLLDKLQFYGVRGKILDWISSFLANRKQRVSLMDTTSDWHAVLSGVPQGSVLGPILFVIFVNSLPAEAVSSQVFLFADDAKVFKSILKPEDQSLLQADIDRLYSWTGHSLLEFHPEKCTSMTLSRQDNCSRTYKVSDTDLRVSSSEKDLGVIVDNKLKFEDHMWEKINKATRIMATIRRVYSYMDKTTFLLLYKALVRPHVEYANQMWCPYLQKHIRSLENVQRRATRQLPGFAELTYEERLRKLELPTLAYRRHRGDMIETYKILTRKYDSTVSSSLFTLNDRISRGHYLKLSKRHAKTNLRKNYFTHRVVETWNNLPESVISAPTTASFECRLDRHWANHPLRFDFQACNTSLHK